MKKLIVRLVTLSLFLVGAVAYGEGNDLNTVLLLHCNGVDGSQVFVDQSVSGHHTVSAMGDMQIDTDQSKLGEVSGLFDGNGDYLSIPDSDDWNFGTGDFTIDCWIRFNSKVDAYFWNQYNNAANHIIFTYYNFGSKIYIAIQNNDTETDISCPWNPSLDTWYHIALVRNGTTENDWHIFINGRSQNLSLESGSWDVSLPNLATTVYIGWDTEAHYFDGWIDELRISKGIARWTSNFAPPKKEYYASFPIAYIRENLIVEEKQLVTLDGSASSVPSGNIAYDWTQISGPLVVLSDETIVNPTFTAPAVDLDTNLEFELVVTDINTHEQSKADYLTITVRPIAEVLFVKNKQPDKQKSLDSSIPSVDIWQILTNKQGEAKPAVKVILLVILALIIFLFIYMKKRAIKSTEEK